MKVYAIFKEGVYRHECGGIFSTLELAKESALVLLSGENDDYHTYSILTFELNAQTTQLDGDLTEPGCVFSCRRVGKIIYQTAFIKQPI